jgi:Protein of unknown function (DUF3634)
VIPVLLLVLFVAAFLYFARSNELFSIVVQSGKQRVTRGYAPPALLADFADVLRGVKHARVRAIKSNGRPELEYRGDIDDVVAQRLRNVLGLYPLTRFKTRHRGGRP